MLINFLGLHQRFIERFKKRYRTANQSTGDGEQANPFIAEITAPALIPFVPPH